MMNVMETNNDIFSGCINSHIKILQKVVHYVTFRQNIPFDITHQDYLIRYNS